MDWASYGFVVAAVEHRDGSAAYTYHLNVVEVIKIRYDIRNKVTPATLQPNAHSLTFEYIYSIRVAK